MLRKTLRNRRPGSRSIVIACCGFGVMWGTQLATGQEPSSTAPAQQQQQRQQVPPQRQQVPPQRQQVPPQRQQAVSVAPARAQALVPGANTANGAEAASANARNLLNKLFPGAAGGGTPAPQPGASAPVTANPSTRAMQTPAAPALQQALGRGTASGNTRSTTTPVHMASLTNTQSAARAVQSRNFLGHPGPAGSTETQTRNGNIVRTAADGSVMDVHSPRNGMYIHHGANGNRQVLVARPDGSRIYASSRGVQFVEHPYVFRGRVFAHRTYVVQGQVFHQFYRPFPYGRTVLDVYATPRYYDANFYQWATSSFNTPQPFKWDYLGNSPPWFGYYKGYFTPDSSYSSPASWLADFVLASSLAASYKNEPQSAPPASGGGGPVVTPEVKQKLAAEVERQVRQEQAEAQQNAQNREPPPGAGSVVQELGDRQTHVYVAASDLDLVDDSGRRCMISEGDVVQVVSAAQPASGSADAVVLASKGGGECERAARVEIALNDLQEMQNHMRETIDQGMASTNAAKKSTAVAPAFVASAPPPDANAAHELDQQQQIAAAIEG
jgi:hypothetical protein